MNNILTIIKKELKRFFTDKRMVLTAILPGLLIFIIYTFMGDYMQDAFQADENHQYNIYWENDNPESYKNTLENIEINGKKIQINYQDEKLTIEQIKEKIVDKELDMYVGFEDDFENKINNNSLPKVTMYYNSTSNESMAIYSSYFTIVSQKSMEPIFTFEPISDLASTEDSSAQVITMMLPYLLIIFLFTGCVANATESIAGEKERGTIATLLVTPIKRSSIAIGKIISLSITSLVSATASFIGLIASLPNLMATENGDFTLSMYNPLTYISIFLIILITVIFFTTILSIVSTFAKNVKEASQWSSMLMIVVMLLGVSSLMGMGNIPSNPLVYLIPIYNCVQCMSGIFALSFNLTNFIITLVSTVCYIGIGVFLLAKMFNSEQIMANK